MIIIIIINDDDGGCGGRGAAIYFFFHLQSLTLTERNPHHQIRKAETKNIPLSQDSSDL